MMKGSCAMNDRATSRMLARLRDDAAAAGASGFAPLESSEWLIMRLDLLDLPTSNDERLEKWADIQARQMDVARALFFSSAHDQPLRLNHLLADFLAAERVMVDELSKQLQTYGFDGSLDWLAE